MNPCFRYVKLRYIDLRKLSYSTVTALKRPEHVVQKEGRHGPNNWPEVDIGVKGVLRLPDLLHIREVQYRTQSQHEQPRGFENLPDQRNLDLEYWADKQHSNFTTDKTVTRNRNLTKRNKNDNKDIGALFGDNTAEINIDQKQFFVSKNSAVSQKEKLAVTKDADRNDLSHRKLQNSGGNKRHADKSNSDDKPTHAQLQAVANYYEDQIKALHARSEDFSRGLHHRHIIFENNYTRMPASCQGIDKYRMALAKMRILGSLSYFTFRFYPVNISLDMEEGAVILHWRLYYINNLRFFTNAAPRALLDRSLKNIYDEDEAISTFYVNGGGQIVRHKIDKTIPLKGEKKAVSLKDKLRKRFNMALT